MSPLAVAPLKVSSLDRLAAAALGRACRSLEPCHCRKRQRLHRRFRRPSPREPASLVTTRRRCVAEAPLRPVRPASGESAIGAEAIVIYIMTEDGGGSSWTHGRPASGEQVLVSTGRPQRAIVPEE